MSIWRQDCARPAAIQIVGRVNNLDDVLTENL